MMTSTIKTLKELNEQIFTEDYLINGEPNETFVMFRNTVIKQHSEYLRQEAIKYVKEIDQQYQFHHNKTFNETMVNTTDGMAPVFRYARVWIMRFFNLTEDDVK